MLEDFRLRVFVTAAEKKSFTAAAKRLGISQPAVSQNVAELEKILGAQLFTRSKGELTLTEDGNLFCGYARQILHWYRIAEEAFRSGQSAPVFQDRVKPVSLKVDTDTDASVWSIDGNIHIEIQHKK